MILTLNTHKLPATSRKYLTDDDVRLMRSVAMQTLRYAMSDSEDDQYRPASLGWFGYEIALCVYGTVMGGEIYLRAIGQYDIWEFANYSRIIHGQGSVMELPPWLQDTDILQSNRSYLLRTDRKGYKKTFPGSPDDWPVLWPVIDEDDIKKYTIVVAKSERQMIKNLPKKVQRRVSNA